MDSPWREACARSGNSRLTERQPEDDCCAFAVEHCIPARHSEREGDADGASTTPKRKKRKMTHHTTLLEQSCKRRRDRLVAGLPKGPLRDAVREDAKALAASLARTCPGVPYLTRNSRLSGTTGARWHQDYYAGRMLITYTQPSTWMADDKSVNFTMFEESIGLPSEVVDPLVVSDYENIYQPPPNSVVLIKGNFWPGIEQSMNGMGVVHKSPNMREDADGNPVKKRLVLKVDLSYDPPEDPHHSQGEE